MQDLGTMFCTNAKEQRMNGTLLKDRRLSRSFWLTAAIFGACAAAGPARAGSTFFFSTGDPDGKMAMASRPSSAGKIEIESADDFVLTAPRASPARPSPVSCRRTASLSDMTNVRVEIYRVFPLDSTIPRQWQCAHADQFSLGRGVRRTDAAAHNLTFTPGIINSSFTAQIPSSTGSIRNPTSIPRRGTGHGPRGSVQRDFESAFTLPADHYFFVPQVQLSNGDFFWLSAPKPIVAPGTPFRHRPPDLDS